jgi:hypothetical protein
VGLYAVGFQMSRNIKNKNPTRTTIFRGSNTQLSVLFVRFSILCAWETGWVWLVQNGHSQVQWGASLGY